MQKRYIFFAIIALPALASLLLGRYTRSFYILPLIYTLYLINRVEGEAATDTGLTRNEKLQVIITEIFNPIIAGAFYYYTWKKQFPKKASQANLYSWIIIGIGFMLGVILYQFGIRAQDLKIYFL